MKTAKRKSKRYYSKLKIRDAIGFQKKKKHAGVNAVDVKMTHWDESPNTEAISSRIPDTIVK